MPRMRKYRINRCGFYTYNEKRLLFCQPVKLQGKTIIIRNTCAFDALLHITAHMISMDVGPLLWGKRKASRGTRALRRPKGASLNPLQLNKLVRFARG